LCCQCSFERSNGHQDIERLAFIGAEGPDFHGIIKFDATTWDVIDSISGFPGVTLIGISGDGGTLTSKSGPTLYRIDIATMDVIDSLVLETDVAEHVLIPEDNVILRSNDESMEIIDLSTLTVRGTRHGPWRALSWNAATRQVVGCLRYRGLDSTIVIFDYEADTLVRQLILRGKDGVARAVWYAILDHERNRILALGRGNGAAFIAMDLESDSCLFQVSVFTSLGDIALSRDRQHCYLTNPGSFDFPGGFVYMLDAASYDLLHSFNGYDQSLPSTEWLVPGKVLVPCTGDAILVVPSQSLNEGPLAILSASSLTYLKSVRIWETPLQFIHAAVINY
jgi:hypothetical protein